MGIQLTVQNSRNYLLNRNLQRSDLEEYMKTNSYTIESSGSRKKENYFISEWAPVIFDNIRRIFGISKETYISSISPQEFITEMMISSTTIIEQLVSTGKSGSMFYYTKDGKFIIKTITQSEYEFLREIVGDYFIYISKNRETLLPKFYGCYKLIKKIRNTKERIYFITMDNIFSTSKEVHLRYDLKGSKIGRREFKNNQKIIKGEKFPYALKDLDFEENTENLFVGEEKKKRILEQINKDSCFLSSKNIIDYSLLVGIHYNNDSIEKETTKKGSGNLINLAHLKYLGIDDLDSKNKKKIIESAEKKKICDNYSNKDKEDLYPESKDPSMQKNSSSFMYQYSNITENQIELNLDNTIIEANKSEESMFREIRIKNLEDGGISSISDGKLKKEIYYMGIIDILTEFKVFKTFEYVSKSLLYCSQGMSCVPPKKYSKRFNEYLKDKFK